MPLVTRRRLLALGALALVCLPRGAAPVFDAASGHAFEGASLALPRGYVLLSPFCRFLDSLSLLTLRQHLLFIGATLLAAVLLGARAAGERSHLARLARGLGGGALALLLLLATYAAGTLLPRPMARLKLDDPSLLAVDFHSHTNLSWDGRRGFDVEHNRRWHALAGFDVAYVTDHGSIEGARAGMLGNPRRAGDGMVLLSGMETMVDGAHVCLLGVGAALDDESAALHAPVVSVLAVPATLAGTPHRLVRDASLAAVELSDAAPKGLDFGDAHHAALAALADTLQLAMVAGSDNHGWGRTAAAWSIMRVPGWRTMSPARLDAEIRRQLVALGPRAARVAARTSYGGSGSRADLFAVPRAAIEATIGLTRPERISWMGWFAIFAWLASRTRAGQRRRATTRSGRDRLAASKIVA